MFFLKTRDHSLSVFPNFKAMIELQYNCKLKSVQNDWGRKFKALPTLLEKEGIVYRRTCVYIFERNGMVKSRIHRVVDTGLILLVQSRVLRALCF